MKKKKVLHLIKSLGRGGAEMLLPETLRKHDTDKFEFHYIYFLPWKNQLADAILDSGGRVSCFPASNNLAILLQYRRIINYIIDHDIQLVHCHLPWAGFVGRILHKKIKIPIIYTEHNKQERYHKITFFINKWTFNWQNQVIAVSQDVHESIQKNIKPRVPVKTILNGVNTDSFKRDNESGMALREKYNIPKNALVIGTIAVFRFQKRLLEWLEVVKTIYEKDKSIYFIIVGDGPLKNEIYKRRAELGLEDQVIMPGLQSEVRPWLSTMDVYMMTSIFEGLPIALLEAMSMECAIVTTDAGGIKEVIRNRVDGLSVDVAEYKILPSLIEELKNNQLKTELSKNARSRVKNAFSLDNMVNELEELYDVLIK